MFAKKRAAGVAAFAASMIAAGSCFADHVIDTYPFWDQNVTNGWFAVAQSFIAPNHNVLNHYMFGFDGSSVNITFEIVPWNENSGPTGAPLFSRNVVGNPGDVVIDNINLALTPGSMYAAIVDMNGYSGASVHYMLNTTGNPTGDASWRNSSGQWQFLNSGWSTKFRAEFGEIPAPGAIALLGVAGVAIRRRRRA